MGGLQRDLVFVGCWLEPLLLLVTLNPLVCLNFGIKFQHRVPSAIIAEDFNPKPLP
jgi:hypothetical protein